MEKKEQERLEEILAMCAQYEEQIDSEIQINSPPTEGSSQSKPDNHNRKEPPQRLDLANVHTSNYKETAAVHGQMPGMLSYHT